MHERLAGAAALVTYWIGAGLTLSDYGARQRAAPARVPA
jgi:hypothetical protein